MGWGLGNPPRGAVQSARARSKKVTLAKVFFGTIQDSLVSNLAVTYLTQCPPGAGVLPLGITPRYAWLAQPSFSMPSSLLRLQRAETGVFFGTIRR